ncbi:MAG: hypothetical protein PHE09_12255 [Oscillospiraceae bacterium]|nr:hypothetical protein [Oscillospiraceae bacterium]
MADQLKNGLPQQCLFMNADGEIMHIEYGKAGFSRSELSTDNRKANREIVNSYNERHGITAEQVSLMHNGALFGWDTLHAPQPPYRQESNVAGGRIFEIEISRPGSFGANTAADISLPAAPYELADALDKARVTDKRVIYSVEIYDCKLDYLPGFLSPTTNLYELNHLAQRLAALSEWELDSFKGMVMMDAAHSEQTIAVERLINMTHSTADCHVVYEAHNDESLGRFYADNGFVPELETLPEKIFPWLDYGKIGKEMREGESGVFIQSGYVVQNGEIAQAYQSGAAISTAKPDYTVLLKVTKGFFNDPKYDNDLGTFLKLPADDNALYRAVAEVDAASPEECGFTAVDCIAPLLTGKINDTLDESVGDCCDLMNELAGQLQQLDRAGDIPIYKAMLEAAPKDISLEEALDLTRQTGSFNLMREVASPADYAAKEVERMMSYENDEGLELYLDMPGYGRFLMERYDITETPYGLLEIQNGKTVEQCLDRSSQSMEMR